MKELETRYLERLSDLYPTIAAASTEIINLQAILNLPKRNRAFSDGYSWGMGGVFPCAEEWIRCGAKQKSRMYLDIRLGSGKKQELATLIYYPKREDRSR